jgi:hypothetical protein
MRRWPCIPAPGFVNLYLKNATVMPSITGDLPGKLSLDIFKALCKGCAGFPNNFLTKRLNGIYYGLVTRYFTELIFDRAGIYY